MARVMYIWRQQIGMRYPGANDFELSMGYGSSRSSSESNTWHFIQSRLQPFNIARMKVLLSRPVYLVRSPDCQISELLESGMCAAKMDPDSSKSNLP